MSWPLTTFSAPQTKPPCLRPSFQSDPFSVRMPHTNFSTTGRCITIDSLNDDVLLEIFDFVRLYSMPRWNIDSEGWYKLVHTCQRWRRIVLASPSRLDLHLYCDSRIDIAEMLDNSPPFPLIVLYGCRRTGMTSEDEEDALFALQHHDRVRRIHLSFASHTPAQNIHTILSGMGAPFPILEELRLTVGVFDEARPTFLSPSLPPTFKAPRLRHLLLTNAGDLSIPRLPLLGSVVGLVTLQLTGIPSCRYLPVDYLVPRLALMPQLDYLCIDFCLNTPTQDVEGQLLHAPMTHVILPCLKTIFFIGDAAYMEGLTTRISAPHLGKFRVTFFNQPTLSLPRLSQFLWAAEQLRLLAATVMFSDDDTASISIAANENDLEPLPLFTPFQVKIQGRMSDCQVTNAGRICAALAPVLSGIEVLQLDTDIDDWPTIEDDIHREKWLELLGPFINLKKLRLASGRLIKELSRALQPDDTDEGPSGVEFLPALRKILRPCSAHFGDTFAAFIAARGATGQYIARRQRYMPRPRRPHTEHSPDMEFDPNAELSSDTELDSD
ncbi:hypothetical protein BJV78DRAFT_1242761 [Lactifluus subvellereus]|nr:hypothetical protein BJV78DRAFT_1242761 [Lactifluus subvellereus]